MNTYEFNVVDETDQFIFVSPRGGGKLSKLSSGDVLRLGNPDTVGAHMILKCFKNPTGEFSCTECDGFGSSNGGKCIRLVGSRFCIFTGRGGMHFKDLTKALEEL